MWEPLLGRAQGWVGRHGGHRSQACAPSPAVECWLRLSCPGLGNNGGCGAGESRAGLSLTSLIPDGSCPPQLWQAMGLRTNVHATFHVLIVGHALCTCSPVTGSCQLPGLHVRKVRLGREGHVGEHSRQPLHGCLAGVGRISGMWSRGWHCDGPTAPSLESHLWPVASASHSQLWRLKRSQVVSAPPLTMTLGKQFTLSQPWFPHLVSGCSHHSIILNELGGGLKREVSRAHCWHHSKLWEDTCLALSLGRF